mmetsp:Transcript_57118/g.127506  ORF Transcript_57118/g.127506 Transcript_57118/m.127506 type:complete len:368 (+) Transcript_57118:1010-2113(+)
MSLKLLKPCSSTRESAVQSCPRTKTAMSLFSWSLPRSAIVLVEPAASACAKCFLMALTALSSTGSASGCGGVLGPLPPPPPPVAGRLRLLPLGVGAATPGAAATPPVCVLEIPNRSRSPHLEFALAAELRRWRCSCTAAAPTEAPAPLDTAMEVLRTRSPFVSAGVSNAVPTPDCLCFCRSSTCFCSSSIFSLSFGTSSSFFSISFKRSSKSPDTTTTCCPSAALAPPPPLPPTPGDDGAARFLLPYLAALATLTVPPLLLRAISMIRSISSFSFLFFSSSRALRSSSSRALRLARRSASAPPCVLRVKWPRTVRWTNRDPHCSLWYLLTCTIVRPNFCSLVAAFRRRIARARFRDSIGRFAINVMK